MTAGGPDNVTLPRPSGPLRRRQATKSKAPLLAVRLNPADGLGVRQADVGFFGAPYLQGGRVSEGSHEGMRRTTLVLIGLRRRHEENSRLPNCAEQR